MTPGRLLACDGCGEAHGFSAVIIFNIVPAIYQLNAAGEVASDRHGGANTEMIVRDGPREQQRSRVVPVAVRFNHLGTRRSHELAEVHLKSFALRRLETDIRLFQITKNLGRLLGRVNHVERAAKAQVHAKAHGIGRMLERDLSHIQAELVSLDIEVTQAIHARRRVVEIQAIVSVHKPAEIDRPDRPFRCGWSRRRGRRLLVRRWVRGRRLREAHSSEAGDAYRA